MKIYQLNSRLILLIIYDDKLTWYLEIEPNALHMLSEHFTNLNNCGLGKAVQFAYMCLA